MNLGTQICAARKAHGMTQEHLAELCDITVSHLKHIESGHRKPSVEVLFRIVQLLNISLDSILLENIKSRNIIYADGLTQEEIEVVRHLVELLKKDK